MPSFSAPFGELDATAIRTIPMMPCSRFSDRLPGSTPKIGLLLLSLFLPLLLSACGGDDDPGTVATDTFASDANAATDGASADGTSETTDPTPGCDPIDPGHCLLPFPSNKFLAPNPKTPTGFQLALRQSGMPANTEGVRVDPKAWNRMDGYGIGWAALALFPDVDVSTLPSELTPTGCLADDASIVLLEVDKQGKATRVPYFAELDDDIDVQDPSERVLMVRPLVIPREATRYVIAFRGLKNSKGVAFPPSKAFAQLRDGSISEPWLLKRKATFDAVFETLKTAGVKRADLQLAWDWTTSSSKALHGDMLHIRDTGLEILGAKGPEFTVKKVTAYPAKKEANIALAVTGTFRVPNFVKPTPIDDETGYRLVRDDAGLPKQDGWRDAPFWLMIPRAALQDQANGGAVQGLMQYGHGLLGTGSQLGAGHTRGFLQADHRIGFAANWTGMSHDEIPAISQMVFDFSDFAIIPEHLHQGMFEQLAIARGVRERMGELAQAIDAKLTAAQRKQVGLTGPLKITLNKARQHYTGDSQGGIYGATYVALSQEVTRAALGVPGQNYSVLLRRSVDFVPFFLLMRSRYQGVIDRALLLQVGQVLWDQVDPVSYYRHMSEAPFANTPKHHVLLAQAKGDFQVAPLTNEITARSGFGIKLMAHYGKPLWQLPPQSYPHVGSGLVSWDYGNAWAKPGPNPPYDSIGDPHGKPRKDPRFIKQFRHFLATGEIIDPCGGNPCAPAK